MRPSLAAAPVPTLASHMARQVGAIAALILSGSVLAAAMPSPSPASVFHQNETPPAPVEQSGRKESPTTAPARPVSKSRVPSVTLDQWTKTRDSASPNDDRDLVLLGRLVYSQVDVTCDDCNVGESIRALTAALGINVAMKFDVEFVDDTPVFLELKDVDGLTALEAIIAQGGGNATWQLRRGILEVGSKTYLARGNGRRTQTYDVSSLLMDIPYTPGIEMAPPDLSTGHGGRFKPLMTLGPDPETYRRKAPVEVAADLMQAIVNQVEPEAWQPIPEGDGTDGTKGPTPKLASGKSSERNQSSLGDRNFDAKVGPPFVRGKWAALDFYRQGGHLIVTAPDFVHRGIGGYGEALPVAPGSS
jgi:hypothetical protein